MMIALHKNARTTPAVRAEIAASDEPVSMLAQRITSRPQRFTSGKSVRAFITLAYQFTHFAPI